MGGASNTHDKYEEYISLKTWKKYNTWPRWEDNIKIDLIEIMFQEDGSSSRILKTNKLFFGVPEQRNIYWLVEQLSIVKERWSTIWCHFHGNYLFATASWNCILLNSFSSGNGYSGDVRFESRPGHRLSSGFSWFSSVPPANVKRVPRMVHNHFLPILSNSATSYNSTQYTPR
jgi:hypothetical protein